MHSGVVFVLAFTLASLFERGSRYFRVDSHVRYRFSPRQTFIWGSYSNYIVTRAPVMEVSNAGRTSQTSDWYTPDGSVIFNAIYILLQRCICCVFPRDIFVSAICCIASKYPFTKFDGSISFRFHGKQSAYGGKRLSNLSALHNGCPVSIDITGKWVRYWNVSLIRAEKYYTVLPVSF